MSQTLSDTFTPGIQPWTPEEYHRRTAFVGHSMLDTLIDDASEFHGRYIAGTIPPKEPSPSMRLGTLLHLFVLQPKEFEARTTFAPKLAPDGQPWNRRTNAHKAYWAEYLETTVGKIAVEDEDMAKIEAMAKAIYAHPVAASYLDNASATEQPIAWRDDETGVLCKSLRDIAIDDWDIPGIGRCDMLVDLKTAADVRPRGFATACSNFGYKRQHPWYQDGHIAVTDRHCEFAFIVVRNIGPWTRGSVAVHKLRENDVERGRTENRAALKEFVRRQESGEWVPEYAEGINEIALPKWDSYQSEYQFNGG